MKSFHIFVLINYFLPEVAPLSLYAPRSRGQKVTPRLPGLPARAAHKSENADDLYKLKGNGIMASAAAATLKSLVSFAPIDDSRESDMAAKIHIDSIPPTSIQLDLTDIPVIGGMLSGSWARVGPLKKEPSVTVRSPKEKFNAIRKFLELGRLEFDISGMLTTHLDVEVEANQKGVASVNFKSALIPKWPFGRSKSDWNRVTNLGTGEIYYFNQVSGVAQYEEPEELK